MSIQNEVIQSSTNETKKLPLVNIPLMSDFKWQYMVLQDRLHYPEKYREKGEDVEATITRLKKWLKEYKSTETQISA